MKQNIAANKNAIKPPHRADYQKLDDKNQEYLEAAFKFNSWEEFKQAEWRKKLLFINRWFLILTGKTLALLYALGTALTIAAAAVGFLCGLTGVMWPGIIAGIFMFVAGFTFNFKITWKSTPKILLDFFGRGKIFKGLTEYFDKKTQTFKQLSKARKRWLIFGIVCAVASAATWSAIGWSKIISALSLLLSVSATTVPPVFLVLTGIIIVGLCVGSFAMLIKEISNLLGKNDIVPRLTTFLSNTKNVLTGKYFKDAYQFCQKEYPDSPKKALIKKLLRDGRGVFIGCIMIGLTVAGLTMMMKTGVADVAKFITAHFGMSSIAASVVAIVNCFVFAFSAELPFALGTSTFATNKINKWLQRKKQAYDAKKQAKQEQPENSVKQTLAHAGKKIWQFALHPGNALGNGLIAMDTFMGNLVANCKDTTGQVGAITAQPDIPMMVFSCLTAAIGSYTAGFHGDEDTDNLQEKQATLNQDNIGDFNMFDKAHKARAQHRHDAAAKGEAAPLLGGRDIDDIGLVHFSHKGYGLK